eukprot:12748943-Heterocapsa_arctica.AAC.1
MKPRTGSKRAVRSNGAWALPSAAAPGCHVASPSAPGCRAGVCSAGGACCTPVGRRDACGAGVAGARVPSAAAQRFVKSSTSGGPPPTRNFVKSSTFGGPPPTWMLHDANLARCVVAPPNGTAAKMSASGTSGGPSAGCGDGCAAHAHAHELGGPPELEVLRVAPGHRYRAKELPRSLPDAAVQLLGDGRTGVGLEDAHVVLQGARRDLLQDDPGRLARRRLQGLVGEGGAAGRQDFGL